ncbi:MAG: UDP-N-acetylmuramate--L-alanine ligase [Nitrospirae bacterium]|nr:UDP-N-acetylmuramate--L-alanine ligase [Nitrospirota bacterium]
MKFHNIERIHFVGIGGSGMNGIAEVLINQGFTVTGSDLADTDVTRRLESLGGKVVRGHHADNVRGAQVVVVSTAVKRDNVEVVAAREAGIPVIQRAEMLAELMRPKYGVAVAGAHGKTTTTSLVATVLGEGGLDPTVVIGGRLNQYGASAKLGKGRYMVAEADESDGSFLKLFPTVAVITNIDREHLDFYGDMDAIRGAFIQFASKVPFYGCVVLCLDEAPLQALLPEIRQAGKRVVTYGFTPQADLRGDDLDLSPAGARFSASFRGHDLGTFRLPVTGRHNAQNAMAALCVGLDVGVDVEVMRRALAGFSGVGRRFERKGEAAGVTVVDDYGHHPTEVQAVLAAARESFPERRLIVVFQPHRYTRTRDQMEGFARAFHAADTLLLMDIYAAGEAAIPGISSPALLERVKDFGHRDARHLARHDDVLATLAAETAPGDVILTLGAGDVWRVGTEFLNRAQRTSQAGGA